MGSCSFFTLLYKEIPLSSLHAMCPEIRKKLLPFLPPKKGTHRKAQKYDKSSISIATKFLGETSLWTSSAGKRCRDLHIPCLVIFSDLQMEHKKAGIHFRHHFIIFNFPFLHLIPDMPKKMKNSSRGFKITNQLSDAAVVLKKVVVERKKRAYFIFTKWSIFYLRNFYVEVFSRFSLKVFLSMRPVRRRLCLATAFLQIILCKISQKCHLLKLFMHQLTRKEESVEWSFLL